MAVIDTLPGLKVTIDVNGEALKEYEDEDGAQDIKFQSLNVNRDRACSTFIECANQPDTEFSLVFEIEPPFRLDKKFEKLFFAVWVDGQGVGGIFVTRDEIDKKQWKAVKSSTYNRVSDTTVATRKLKFCAIKKIDDVEADRVKADVKHAQFLGELRVNIWGYTEDRSVIVDHKNDIQSSPNTEIAEKALKGKALSHGAGFGSEIRIAKPQECLKVYPDGYNNPMAMFRFKYRSRQALQSELIIPRSPSPEPAARPSNLNNGSGVHRRLTRDERLAALKREIDEIKQEDAAEGSQSRKRPSDFVNPRSGKSYKTSHTSGGDLVVDLTDD